MTDGKQIKGRDVYEWILAEVGMYGNRRGAAYPYLGTCRIDAAEVELRFWTGAVQAAVAYGERFVASHGVELCPRYTATVTEAEARRSGWTPKRPAAGSGPYTGPTPGMRVRRKRDGAPQPGDYVFVQYTRAG